MIWEKDLIGKYVVLRYVKEEDAEKVLSIRQDRELTKFLPRLDITVEEQRKWIKKQQNTEGDYYFAVWNHAEEMIGTIRVYNILNGEAETGSLAIRGNAFENLEAKLLCEDFMWDTLGIEKSIGVVNYKNIQAQKFAKLFGVEFDEPSDDERGFKCVIGHNSKERSVAYRNKIRKMLYK